GEGALDNGEYRLRLRGVELAHGAANRRLNALRLARRPHDQVHGRVIAGKLPAELGDRSVHDRQVALVLRWRPGDVFDHADDELWIAPVANVATERRIAFQVDANVGLGDDGNALRSISVVSIEEPALEQLGANGLEVVRAGVDDTVARNLLPFIANLAEDHDACAPRAAGRRRVGVRDRLHTGLPAHALDDGLRKLHRLFVRVALRLQLETGDDEELRLESALDVCDEPERLRDKTGSGEEHECDREFADNQRATRQRVAPAPGHVCGSAR